MTMNLSRRVQMLRPLRPLQAGMVLAALLAAATPASAQFLPPLPPINTPPPPITATFNFAVPFALAVSHPCQTAIVALSGTLDVSLTTITGTDFKFQVGVSTTGEGREAGANGVALPNGSLPYAYASSTAASAQFPDGTPASFAHPLTVDGEMIRSDTDAFTLTAVLELEYASGVPATPKLRTIDVSCK
jgi:hypothetical protein